MRTTIAWTVLTLGAGVAFACGSNSPGNFGGGGSPDTGDGGGTSSSSSSGGVTGSSSGSGGNSSSFSTSGAGSGMGNGTCKTGEYVGTFTCEFYLGDGGGLDASADGGLVSVSGTLSFALTQNISSVGEGTGMDTAMGTFAANTGGVIAATADLNGTLNCGQGVFTGALTNGDYGLNF